MPITNNVEAVPRGYGLGKATNTTMLNAMIFGSTPSLVSRVHQMCAEFRDVCVYRSVDHFPRTHELMQLLNAYTPDVIFVEFEASGTLHDLIAPVRLQHSSMAILAFASEGAKTPFVDTPSGVIRVIPYNCTAEEFRVLLAKAIDERRVERSDNLVAFLPAKAGDGATTVALTFASQLQRQWNQKVLLVESDLHSGPLSVELGLEPNRSLVEALENSHHMTEDRWSAIVENAGGLHLLTAYHARVGFSPSEWSYLRLLAFARSRYNTVVCDLPEVLTDATAAIVNQARRVFIVCTPRAASLHLVHKQMNRLAAYGVRSANISIILNAYDSHSKPVQQIETFLRCAVAAVLPRDERGVIESVPASDKSDIAAACTLVAHDWTGSEPVSPLRGRGGPPRWSLARLWAKPA